MAKLDYSKIFIKEACPTSIGGQAVLGGVMMKGPDRTALAMRMPSGELYLKTSMNPKDSKVMKVPFVRGIVAFARSLVGGVKTLMDSADILEEYSPEEDGEDDEKPGRVESWITKKFGDRAVWNLMMISSVVLAVVVALAFFVVIPTWAVNMLGRWVSNPVILNLAEGLLRIAMFIGYVAAVRCMEDIKTLFRYHGAEHKVIHCYENDRLLIPENAAKFSTLHPRCGTSFMVFVLILSLLLFSFLGWPNLLLRITSRILLIPVIAGISYELLKWAGRSDNIIVKILSWPGLMLQKLTTAEPTEDQLEVAILSLKAVLVDPGVPEIDGFVDKDGNPVRSSAEEKAIGIETEKWAAEVEAHTEANRKAVKEFIEENRKVGERTIFESDEIKGADEEEINRAIRFLSELDSDGYTIVTPAENDGYSIVQAIADREVAESKARLMARRYTKDIKTYENALDWGQAALGMLPNGKNEARIIMSYATGLGRAALITRAKELMNEDDFDEFEKGIYARISGTPLQYIVGIQEFMGLPFRVNESVFIPRLDTEILAEQVLEIIKNRKIKAPDVLDVCAGSGAIGISIAAKCPSASVTLTDISEDALRTALSNAKLNGTGGRCVFLQGDMFDAVSEDRTFDIIVCNPPYIESDVINTLDVEVRDHEPRIALDGGPDGLHFYRIIANEASMHLKSGGILALEIGAKQAVDVKRLLLRAKTYRDLRTIKDLAHLDRVVIAERI